LEKNQIVFKGHHSMGAIKSIYRIRFCRVCEAVAFFNQAQEIPVGNSVIS